MPKTSSPPRLRVVAPPPPLPDPRPPVPQIPITVADDPRLPEPDRMMVRAASEFLALEADSDAWEEHRWKVTDERSCHLRDVVRDSPARSWWGLYAKAQMIVLFTDCMDTQEKS